MIIGVGIGAAIGANAKDDNGGTEVAGAHATPGSSFSDPAPIVTELPDTPLPSSSEAPPPPAVPSPDAKYHGVCDYTLTQGDDLSHSGDFIGEVDVSNTGNIGVVVQVRIHWNQLGYAPISLTKTVRVPYNRSEFPVRFHYAASFNEIDRYQSADEGSTSACGFRATLTDTFGTAH